MIANMLEQVNCKRRPRALRNNEDGQDLFAMEMLPIKNIYTNITNLLMRALTSLSSYASALWLGNKVLAVCLGECDPFCRMVLEGSLAISILIGANDKMQIQ